jgi:hypothetical protein
VTSAEVCYSSLVFTLLLTVPRLVTSRLGNSIALSTRHFSSSAFKEDRTWEPKGNLGNAKAALDLFHERNPQVNLRMMFSEHTKLYNPYIDRLEVNP